VSRYVVCRCGEWVFVDDGYRKATVPCAKCGAVLAAPLPENTTNPDILPAWVTTRNGLSVAFYALLVGTMATTVLTVWVLATIAFPGMTATVLADEQEVRTLMVLPIWSILTICAAGVAMIVGWALCCGVPKPTGGRPPLYTALASVAVAMLLVFWAQFLFPSPRQKPRSDISEMKMQSPVGPMAGRSAASVLTGMRICLYIAMLLSIAGQAFFAAFLGAVGKAKGGGSVAGWVVAFVSLQGMAAIWVTIFCFGAVYRPSPEAAKTLIAATLAGSLLSDICLLRLVHQVRKMIRY
jgi:hypothetical protein